MNARQSSLAPVVTLYITQGVDIAKKLKTTYKGILMGIMIGNHAPNVSALMHYNRWKSINSAFCNIYII